MFKVAGIGVTELMALATNPNKAGGLLVEKMPGAAHTLARLRLAQDIAARAAILSNACHMVLAQCLLGMRDPTPEELTALKTQEFELLAVAVKLHKMAEPEGFTMAQLADAYGMASQVIGEAKGTA